MSAVCSPDSRSSRSQPSPSAACSSSAPLRSRWRSDLPSRGAGARGARSPRGEESAARDGERPARRGVVGRDEQQVQQIVDGRIDADTSGGSIHMDQFAPLLISLFGDLFSVPAVPRLLAGLNGTDRSIAKASALASSLTTAVISRRKSIASRFSRPP